MRKLVAAIAFVVASLAAPAGAGINNSATCTASGTTVTATGLPTNQVINFLLNDDAGTTGWVLGYTADGTWVVAVPAPGDVPVSYQFVSRTRGPDGKNYTTFATCWSVPIP